MSFGDGCKKCGTVEGELHAIPKPKIERVSDESIYDYYCTACGIEKGFLCKRHKSYKIKTLNNAPTCIECFKEYFQNESLYLKMDKYCSEMREKLSWEVYAELENKADAIREERGEDFIKDYYIYEMLAVKAAQIGAYPEEVLDLIIELDSAEVILP